jgi:hypothetical protein
MALTQVTPDVLHNIQSNVTQVGTLSNLTVSGNISSGNLSVIGTTTLSTALAIDSGGTGATTSATALDNLLPSGEQTGYVLATTGAGSYFWTNPSTGGSTVGQQLTTTRQANTATAGQSLFTLVSGRSYTPGTGQLRVYINGVRQYPSEYTETSNVSYTITGGVSSGDLVLAEIDQFSTFNNFANLTFASNVGNISAADLTVQSAIASLENNKAPLSNPVFTGNVTATNLIGAITSSQVTTALGYTPPTTGGFSNMQVFTSSGTFTVPTGITKVKVTVVGGGGGGFVQAQGENADVQIGGNAGGCAIEIISGLTPGGTVSVTVGGGGAGTNNGQFGTPTPGGTGGTSSFGAFCSATGGGGGASGNGAGIGTGGQLNVSGGSGNGIGDPGTSIFAGGFGCGGFPAANGQAGVVVVEW